MAKPKNLEINMPDYCSSCVKGEYDFETCTLFIDGKKTTFYDIVCRYSDICEIWASKGD